MFIRSQAKIFNTAEGFKSMAQSTFNLKKFKAPMFWPLVVPLLKSKCAKME